jgi:response regulator RpfG family c-di-GMP phosphodiesterase
MDLRMPVMDGYEATRRIKSTPEGQNIAIIALTASAFEEDREKIIGVGCDDFVRKPFQHQEIFDMLAKHLGARFLYEDTPSTSVHSPPVDTTVALSDIATQSDSSILPEGWLEELQEAVLLAENEQMLETIDRLEGQHGPLASALRKLVADFEYEKILTFIDKARKP